YDLPEILVAEEFEALAQGLFAFPELLRHRLVDQDDERRTCAVHFGDVAAAAELDPESVEVADAHLVGGGELADGARGRLLPLGDDGAPDPAPQGGVPGQGSQTHARGCPGGLQETASALPAVGL